MAKLLGHDITTTAELEEFKRQVNNEIVRVGTDAKSYIDEIATSKAIPIALSLVSLIVSIVALVIVLVK